MSMDLKDCENVRNDRHSNAKKERTPSVALSKKKKPLNQLDVDETALPTQGVPGEITVKDRQVNSDTGGYKLKLTVIIVTILLGFITLYECYTVFFKLRSHENLKDLFLQFSSKNLFANNSDMVSVGMEEIDFRLPPEVRPLHYDLYLHPDLNRGTFSGRVSILIDLSNVRKFLVLHQQDLNIDTVSLHRHDPSNQIDTERDSSEEIEIKESYPINKKEVFIIVPDDDLKSGQYDLKLSFTGSLQNKIVGFYSSKYKDEFNNTRVIATSKFEPTYARKSFPCFDEPGFKAEFSIKLVYPNGDHYSALSNMNCESLVPDDPAPGLTTAIFAKSVPMSTYLACFIISDFVAVTKMTDGMDGRVFPVSVYTTKAQKEKGVFALNVGVKIIKYYIDLFKIDYPLPKLDMAAIPDFVSGAMENWGLVTYREARLLYDEKTTSNNNKLDIVLVIAHEFAHMWFGNLVTMAWWNDLWLNEGFATFMQFKSSSEIFPEWNFMDQFLLLELHPAFATDAKLSSHPIVQTVSNPDQITAIFDVISYQKGSSILRMLENFVGTENFYKGVTKYLKKFSYGNAETDNLLKILQSTVGDQININAIMDTWTRQMGFPVVTVKKYKYKYILTQKRFLANQEAKYNPNDSPFLYKWTIPITYITSENPSPTLIWFDKDADDLIINTDEPISWIKFNCDQVGYYRVNYEESEWDSLLGVLRSNHETFTTQDRTHLLEDAFSLANAGELDYAIAMNMTLYLLKEKNYSPWYVATNKLKGLDTLLTSTPSSDKIRAYVRELVDPIYRYVSWNVDKSESQDKLNLRSPVLDLACSMAHEKCMEEVGSIFKDWIRDDEDVRPHPDIRGLVYYYGMKQAGGEFEWNVMFKRFIEEKNAAEKSKLMNGLAGIRSSSILQKFITFAMDEDYVRSQDALSCLVSISNNPEGRNILWDWVRENWMQLVDRYTLNDRYLGQLIPAITKKFSTEVKLEEMKRFFEKYPEAGAGDLYRAQALETVESNIKWLEKNVERIDWWLELNPKPNVGKSQTMTEY